MLHLPELCPHAHSEGAQLHTETRGPLGRLSDSVTVFGSYLFGEDLSIVRRWDRLQVMAFVSSCSPHTAGTRTALYGHRLLDSEPVTSSMDIIARIFIRYAQGVPTL